MPQELPGFYYDEEKNRYFPIKAAIPGSRVTSKKPRSDSGPKQKENNILKRIDFKTSKMLQNRELSGNVIMSTKRKRSFREEYQKLHISAPVIWKNLKTERIAECALEHGHMEFVGDEGQVGVDVLLGGGVSSYLSLSEIAKVGKPGDYGTQYKLVREWPHAVEDLREDKPRNVLRRVGYLSSRQATFSCIKMFPERSGSSRHGLVTTLGSDESGGTVSMLNLTEPLDVNPYQLDLTQRMHEVERFNCTIWTADCSSAKSQAVIGTDMGASLINMETGRSSWVFRGKSDVLSQQFDQSGNVVLCGLRNGAILTVDVRQKEEAATRLVRHRIPLNANKFHDPLRKSRNSYSKQWFKLEGDICPGETFFMPSSISCLVSLQLYDQYFLASSMDGLIRLYDHRQIKGGPVQSYEGNVNSHTRLHLGVDPTESFLISGGEDQKLRLWSIKSGELLFEEAIPDSVISTVCWPRSGRSMELQSENISFGECPGMPSLGAWLGSREGIYQMQWL